MAKYNILANLSRAAKRSGVTPKVTADIQGTGWKVKLQGNPERDDTGVIASGALAKLAERMPDATLKVSGPKEDDADGNVVQLTHQHLPVDVATMLRGEEVADDDAGEEAPKAPKAPKGRKAPKRGGLEVGTDANGNGQHS